MAVSIQAARATMRERAAQERRRGQERAERILARVPEIVRRLRDAGAGKVVLFGSLATDRARADSDLDLAVEGLPAERYFTVLAEVMQLAGCPVDLVRLEDAVPSLRDRIAIEGRPL